MLFRSVREEEIKGPRLTKDRGLWKEGASISVFNNLTSLTPLIGKPRSFVSFMHYSSARAGNKQEPLALHPHSSCPAFGTRRLCGPAPGTNCGRESIQRLRASTHPSLMRVPLEVTELFSQTFLKCHVLHFSWILFFLLL